MVQFLKRWFRPSRFDACCFVIAIQWMVVLFSVAILPSMPNGHVPIESGMAILVAFGTLIAIAATQCWKSNSNRRTLMLVVSSIASVGCVVGWYYFNSGYVDAKRSVQFGLQTAELPSFDVAGFLWGSLVHLRNAIAAACVVWLVNLAIFRVSRSAKLPLARMIQRLRADRTGMLMGVAAVMFLLAIVGRLLSSTDSRTSNASVSSMAQVTAAILGYGSAWLILLFWFPRSFVHKGVPIQKVVSLLLVVALCPMFFSQLIGNASAGDGVIVLVAVVAFVFSVIGIGGVHAAAEERPETSNRFVGSRPTFFSILPVVLLMVAIGFYSSLDLGVFASPQRNATFAQQIAQSRESVAVTRESGGRITLVSDPSFGGSAWRVWFDESAPKDLVKAVLNRGGRCVELCNLTPEFDMSAVNGSGIVLLMTDCEVSHTQLSDILSSGAWLRIRGKFAVVDDGTEIDSSVVNSIVFQNIDPGVIQKFFEVANCENQMLYTMVHSPVGDQDWPMIEELAQSGSVYLYGGWEEGFQLPPETRSLSRIHFQDLSSTNGKPKPVDRNLVFNTDMKLTFSGSIGNDPAIAWKLMLLRGDFGGYSLEHYWNLSNSPIDEFAKEIGLSYQLNADQTIHSIYLPLCSGIQLEGLDEVRVLSFDPAWVEGASIGSGRGVPTSLSSLNSLTNLEELYFEIGFVPEDLSFLNHLTSLKHLQIPSVLRKVTGPIGFDACQTLESITFFGKPDNTTYREIIRLENLKRLVIVNSENDSSLNDQYLMKLRKKFAGVDADIILPSETESLVPKPFREFRARIRKELREDTSWLDEILEK
jgi:hypothetical protein